MVLLTGQQFETGLDLGQPLTRVVLGRLPNDQLRGRLEDRVVHDEVVLLRARKRALETRLVRLEESLLLGKPGLEQGRVANNRVEDFANRPTK